MSALVSGSDEVLFNMPPVILPILVPPPLHRNLVLVVGAREDQRHLVGRFPWPCLVLSVSSTDTTWLAPFWSCQLRGFASTVVGLGAELRTITCAVSEDMCDLFRFRSSHSIGIEAWMWTVCDLRFAVPVAGFSSLTLGVMLHRGTPGFHDCGSAYIFSQFTSTVVECCCKIVVLWSPGPHSIALSAGLLDIALRSRLGSDNVTHVMSAFNGRCHLFVLGDHSGFQGLLSTPSATSAPKKTQAQWIAHIAALQPCDLHTIKQPLPPCVVSPFADADLAVASFHSSVGDPELSEGVEVRV